MIGVDVGATGGAIGGCHNNDDECTMTQQPARKRGGATRGGSVDKPANKRRCRNSGHEEEMEVADAMAAMEEDAVGVEMVAVGWENEDNETGIEDYVEQQELGASVDNERWCQKRQWWTVGKQMVS